MAAHKWIKAMKHFTPTEAKNRFGRVLDQAGCTCLHGVFLEANGLIITADNASLLAFIMSSLEAGSFTKDNLDEWLRVSTAQA